MSTGSREAAREATARGDVALPERLEPFYGGRWHRGRGEGFQTVNPATGELLARVGAAGPADVDAAVAAARAVQPAWAGLAPSERASCVRELGRRVMAEAEALALLDAADSGNPYQGMLFDTRIAGGLLDYFAGLATELKGETIPMGTGRINFVLREPLGVVARLIAFNHPLMFACIKAAAPLVAGNAVIVKPSEFTPLSALRLAELAQELFPAGVFNVLPGGPGTGAALTRHPAVDNVSLVGSVPTGRKVLEGAASTIKRTLLELGGKNALIVYPDVDLDRAAESAVKGMNFGWTAGQSCGSTSRVLAHADIHDALVEKIAARMEAISLGLPTDPDCEMGTLSSRQQYDKTLSYIALGQQEGARLVTGGKPTQTPHPDGFFVRPTLFADVAHGMRIAREEIFGPVLSVLKWSDEEEMIEIANGVEYGLTAAVFTRDLDRAFKTVGRLQAGYVWVNNASDHFLGAPFGGYKQSGMGREECLDELLAFTQQKNVNVALAP